ncbi:hypothetical protein UREOM_6760 [Ureaplasma sp. OM1]|uniref:J domain-containing protein n=1 Tax=Ureaplasma ceti TaxID=3119530 RepID=A0ABP9U8H7_9BACT
MTDYNNRNFSKDYYAILGVKQTSSSEEIKRAYLTLAKKYHPDRNKAPNAAELFKEVREAYEILSDVNLRQQYDQYQNKQNTANQKTYTQTQTSNQQSYYAEEDSDDEYWYTTSEPLDVYFEYNYFDEDEGTYFATAQQHWIDNLILFFQKSNTLALWLNELQWIKTSKFNALNNIDDTLVIEWWYSRKYVLYLTFCSQNRLTPLAIEDFVVTISEILLNLTNNITLNRLDSDEYLNLEGRDWDIFLTEEINAVYWPQVPEQNIYHNLAYYKKSLFYQSPHYETTWNEFFQKITSLKKTKTALNEFFSYMELTFSQTRKEYTLPSYLFEFFCFHTLNKLYSEIDVALAWRCVSYKDYIKAQKQLSRDEKRATVVDNAESTASIIFSILKGLFWIGVVVGIGVLIWAWISGRL